MPTRQILPALFLGLILSSCSTIPAYSDEIGYKWEFKRAPIDKSKWQVFHVEPFSIQCGGAYACSIIKQPNIYCHIYIPVNSPEWVLEHERKHCSGWNHQPRSYSQIQYLLK